MRYSIPLSSLLGSKARDRDLETPADALYQQADVRFR